MELILEFERPLVELYKRIDALKTMQEEEGHDLSASIAQLRDQAERLHRQIFSVLTPWQRAQLSRHPRRPYTLDYVDALFTDWMELRGDRAGHEDEQPSTNAIGHSGQYSDREHGKHDHAGHEVRETEEQHPHGPLSSEPMYKLEQKIDDWVTPNDKGRRSDEQDDAHPFQRRVLRLRVL